MIALFFPIYTRMLYWHSALTFGHLNPITMPYMHRMHTVPHFAKLQLEPSIRMTSIWSLCILSSRHNNHIVFDDDDNTNPNAAMHICCATSIDALHRTNQCLTLPPSDMNKLMDDHRDGTNHHHHHLSLLLYFVLFTFGTVPLVSSRLFVGVRYKNPDLVD